MPLLSVAAFVLVLSSAEWELPRDSPAVLHAAALDRELDGEIAAALELLRAAQALAPAEPTIAFDLARIALENDSASFDADVAGFLALPTAGDDERVLRAYVLARQGLRQAAREQLAALAPGLGDPGELGRLRDLVSQEALAAPARPWSASLRLGIEGDSNVTVIPDAPRREEGLRLAMQGAVAAVPVRAPTELTVQALLRYGPHLNHRAVLEEFDIASATALVRARRAVGAARLMVQLSGNEVVIDNFSRQFMKDLFADLELRRPWAGVEVAAFARGGYRDFAAFNPEADPDDRDGVHYALGGVLDAIAGRWAIGAQAAFAGVETDGRRQRELGAELGGYARWAALPWQVRLAIGDALRVFPQSRSGGTTRVDNRLTSSLNCNRMLGERLGVFASLTWVKNFSTQTFAYDRLLAQVGMVSQW